MEIFINELPDCLRQVFVKAMPDEVNGAFVNVLREMQAEYKVDGFRKGKVPIEIVEKNNTQQVINHVGQRLVNQAVHEIITQGVQIYSEPNVTPISSGVFRDMEYKFSLAFEVLPYVKTKIDLSKITIDYDEYFLNDKMIDKLIRNEVRLLEEVSGKIQKGDTVTLKVLNEGFTNDKEVVFDTGYVESFVSHKKGDTFELTFAEIKHYVADFLGLVKEPLKIEILKVERQSSGKLSDETIKQTTGFDSLAEYKKSMESRFNITVDNFNYQQKRKALLLYLGNNFDVELPKTIYINNARSQLSHFINDNYSMAEISLADLFVDEKLQSSYSELPKLIFTEVAAIISLEDIAEKEGIEINKDVEKKLIEGRASENRMTVDDYKSKSTQEEWHNLQFEAKRETALAYLLDKVKFQVKDKLPMIKLDK